MDDREAYEFYADPAHLAVSGPGRKRQGQVPRPRTFSCPHLSIGNVTQATCGTCGPLAAVA